MFNKKLDRFSIRKLTVGAASVLIGVSFLNLNTNDQVKAAENTDDKSISQTAATSEKEETNKESALQVKTANTNDSKQNSDEQVGNSQKIAKTLAIEKADAKKQAVDPDKIYKVHITTWDDANNKVLSYSRGDRISGDFTGKDGAKIGNLMQPIAGYKLMNPDAITSNFKLGDDGVYRVDGKDVNITLHYMPLSDIKVEYIDEDTNKVLASFVMPNTTSTVASPQYLAGDKTASDASKYEAHAIDIPGYKLVSKDIVDGKVDGQTQKIDDPNYVVITFKYKKTTANSDMELPNENKDVGAKISGGWHELPGMFGMQGSTGKTYEATNGDIEKKTSDLINKYINQGFSYLGTNAKVYNKDYYNVYSTGTYLHLIPNKNVTVNFIDKDGKKLAPSQTISFNKDNPNQINNGVDPKNYWYAKGDWKADAKEINGYHLVQTQGATSGSFTAYSYVVNFVYAQNDPVVTTEKKTVTRTINYVYEDGKVAAQEVKQPIVLTRTKTTTFDGKVRYTGWSKGEYDEVKSPEIKGYTPDKILVSRETANADKTETVTYKRNADKVETESKQVTRTIHYVYSDGKKASDDKAETIKLTRTKTTDAVSGKVSYGEWSKASYSKVESPIIKGYTADKTEIAASPATEDEEETVTYTAIPTPQPQPEPQPDPVPVPEPQPQPTPTPDPKPDTPNEPDVPAPHGEDVPTKPEEPKTVMPHGEDVPAPHASKQVTPVKVSAVKKSEGTVAPHASELPQTGSNDDTTAAAIGLALVGLTGILSLAGASRKVK